MANWKHYTLETKTINHNHNHTGQTAYTDEPRGQSTPQKELNNIYTQTTLISKLKVLICRLTIKQCIAHNSAS